MAELQGTVLPVMGIDTSAPAEYIKGSPNSFNMDVEQSTLVKRVGLSLLGGQITGTNKTILAGREFTVNGVNNNIRIGEDKVEKWNGSTKVWDSIGPVGDLSVSSTDEVSIATPFISGNRMLVFTTPVDAPYKYTGSGQIAALGGTPPKAKYCMSFGPYLLLANITDDGGSSYPNRVDWCDTGDPENWNTVTSNAGNLTLTDGGDITGAYQFGNYATIHKKDLIYIGYLTGSDSIFRFDAKYSPGTAAHNTIKMLPNGQMAYLSFDGIRFFNGSSSILVDSPINEDIRKQLNASFAYTSWGLILPKEDEYWCGIPLGSDTVPNTVVRINYKTGKVYKHKYTNIRSAWGFSNTASMSWNEDTEVWDNATDRWNDGEASSGFPILSFSNSTGYTYRRDTAVTSDAGVAIEAVYESKDFTNEIKNQLGRWKKIEIWAKGTSVDVLYSVDAGGTWYDLGTVTLDSNYPADSSPDILYFDVVSSKIRFKFRHAETTGTFTLKQFYVWVTPREVRGM